MPIHLRPATPSDLPRIHEIRHGTAENRLSDPSRVSGAEVLWYMEQGAFFISEDDEGMQGFGAANPLNSYVWALFVIDPAHGRGHGSALLEAMLGQLATLGHRQVHLTTGSETKAFGFYERRGFRCTGLSFGGEAVLVRLLEAPGGGQQVPSRGRRWREAAPIASNSAAVS